MNGNIIIRFSDQQLNLAEIVDTVKGAGPYHGGEILYTPLNNPGTWHEDCLEEADER